MAPGPASARLRGRASRNSDMMCAGNLGTASGLRQAGYTIRERQTACSAAATGDCVRRDQAGQARPQKNGAPVPGVPGLQQSQFVTLGDTETAKLLSCKGRANSEQVRSSQIASNPDKRGKAGAGSETRANVSQRATSAWAAGAVLTGFRSIRWCDRRRLVTKLQARADLAILASPV